MGYIKAQSSVRCVQLVATAACHHPPQAASQLHPFHPRPEDGLLPFSLPADAWHLWTWMECLRNPHSLFVGVMLVGTHWDVILVKRVVYTTCGMSRDRRIISRNKTVKKKERVDRTAKPMTD